MTAWWWWEVTHLPDRVNPQPPMCKSLDTTYSLELKAPLLLPTRVLYMLWHRTNLHRVPCYLVLREESAGAGRRHRRGSGSHEVVLRHFQFRIIRFKGLRPRRDWLFLLWYPIHGHIVILIGRTTATIIITLFRAHIMYLRF